jgi:hypothetical protein
VGLEADLRVGQKIKVPGEIPLFHRSYAQRGVQLSTNTPLRFILMALMFIANAFFLPVQFLV